MRAHASISGAPRGDLTPPAYDVNGSDMSGTSPAQHVEQFLDKYSPEIASLARAALQRMRKRLPGAVQLVYDNYNALAIGFGPTERASDAVFSIAVWPRWVSLFFFAGASLDDPHNLLRGTGRRARHIKIDDVAVFDDPRVRALMNRALDRAGTRLTGRGGRIVIRSVSGRQRPRRPAGAGSSREGSGARAVPSRQSRSRR